MPLTWRSVSSDSCLRGSTIAIISAQVPGQHMWAQVQDQSLQNRGNQMVVLSLIASKITAQTLWSFNSFQSVSEAKF